MNSKMASIITPWFLQLTAKTKICQVLRSVSLITTLVKTRDRQAQIAEHKTRKALEWSEQYCVWVRREDVPGVKTMVLVWSFLSVCMSGLEKLKLFFRYVASQFCHYICQVKMNSLKGYRLYFHSQTSYTSISPLVRSVIVPLYNMWISI